MRAPHHNRTKTHRPLGGEWLLRPADGRRRLECDYVWLVSRRKANQEQHAYNGNPRYGNIIDHATYPPEALCLEFYGGTASELHEIVGKSGRELQQILAQDSSGQALWVPYSAFDPAEKVESPNGTSYWIKTCPPRRMSQTTPPLNPLSIVPLLAKVSPLTNARHPLMSFDEDPRIDDCETDTCGSHSSRDAGKMSPCYSQWSLRRGRPEFQQFSRRDHFQRLFQLLVKKSIEWRDREYFKEAHVNGAGGDEELLMNCMLKEGISDSVARLLVLQIGVEKGESFADMVKKSQFFKYGSREERVSHLFDVLCTGGSTIADPKVNSKDIRDFIEFIFPSRSNTMRDYVQMALFHDGEVKSYTKPEFTDFIQEVTRRCEMISKMMNTLSIVHENRSSEFRVPKQRMIKHPTLPGNDPHSLHHSPTAALMLLSVEHDDTTHETERLPSDSSLKAANYRLLRDVFGRKSFIRMHRDGKMLFEILARNEDVIPEQSFTHLYDICQGLDYNQVFNSLVDLFQTLPPELLQVHSPSRVKQRLTSMIPSIVFPDPMGGSCKRQLTRAQFDVLAKLAISTTTVDGLFESLVSGSRDLLVKPETFYIWTDSNLKSFVDAFHLLFRDKPDDAGKRTFLISWTLFLTIIPVWWWCNAFRMAVGVLTPSILAHFSISIETMSYTIAAYNALNLGSIFLSVPLLSWIGFHQSTVLLTLALLVLYIVTVVASFMKSASLFLFCLVLHAIFASIVNTIVYPLLVYVFEGDFHAVHFPVILQVSYTIVAGACYPLIYLEWTTLCVVIAALQGVTLILQFVRGGLLHKYPSEGSEFSHWKGSVLTLVKEKLEKCKPKLQFWRSTLKGIPARSYPLMVTRAIRAFSYEAVSMYATFSLVTMYGMSNETAASYTIAPLTIIQSIAAVLLAPIAMFKGRFTLILVLSYVPLPFVLASLAFTLPPYAYVIMFAIYGTLGGVADNIIMPSITLGTNANGAKVTVPLAQVLRGVAVLGVPLIWQQTYHAYGLQTAWFVSAAVCVVGLISAILTPFIDKKWCDGACTDQAKLVFFSPMLQ